MKDYLHNLAEQLFESTESIRPRLATRFEPMPRGGEQAYSFAQDEFDEMPSLAESALFERDAESAPAIYSGQRPRAQPSVAARAETRPPARPLDLPTPDATQLLSASRQARRENAPAIEPAPSRIEPSARDFETGEGRRAPAISTSFGPPARPAPDRAESQAQRQRADLPPPLRAGAEASAPPPPPKAPVPAIERSAESTQFPPPLDTRRAQPVEPSPSTITPIVTPIVRPIVRPTVRPAFAPMESARVETAAPTTPVIRVTIGRIEVRAVPPPPPPQPREAPPAPKLSLDEYLRARQGGQR